jgi:hypothetical protein
VHRRKVPWKHNTIRTSRANLALPDSKGGNNREIRTDKNVNANSVRSRVAEVKGMLAGNKAALSKVGNHKPWINKRREATPAVSFSLPGK